MTDLPASVPEPENASAPDVPAVSQAVPAASVSPEIGVRHQLNSLTPIATTIPLVVAILVITTFAGGGAAWTTGLAGVPVAVFICLGGGALVLVYRYLAWRRFEYWFDEVGDLRIDSGVVYRNERKVQLSRLQAVDIERPLLARIFGLAELRIEVAGAGDSKVLLAYLTNDEADRLRHYLLASARGQQVGDSALADHAQPETVLYAVPDKDLLVSLLIRTSTAGLLLATAVLIGLALVSNGVMGLVLLPFTGGIPLLIVFSEFINLYGFTIAKAHDGVRLRYGLLRTQAQTVPMGRVMAVEIIEPLLWRPKGWVRVRLTVAGVAGGDNNDQSNSLRSILIPVGSRDVADEVLRHVLPGVDIEAVPLTPTPPRARWRAPIQWSRLAYGYNEHVFVARRGRVTRHLSVVPHARTQSVSLLQGPWQRRVGLSTLRIDIPPGPVKVEALYFPVQLMREEAVAQVVRARSARVGDWAEGDSSAG